jgi:hypothetical protein
VRGVSPGNMRWPWGLLHVDDFFYVDEQDFNSAKSSVSQYKKRNPEKRFVSKTQRDEDGQRFMTITRLL